MDKVVDERKLPTMKMPSSPFCANDCIRNERTRCDRVYGGFSNICQFDLRGFVEECMARTNCPMNGHAQKLLASVGNDPKYDPRNKNNQGESSRKLPRRITKHKRKCKGGKKYGKHKKSKKSKKHRKNKKSDSIGSEKAGGKDKSSGSGSEKNSGSESEE